MYSNQWYKNGETAIEFSLRGVVFHTQTSNLFNAYDVLSCLPAIMSSNPLRLSLPPFHTIKHLQPHVVIPYWIAMVKKLNPEKRRLLRVVNVKPLFVKDARMAYSKNDPRTKELIREADSPSTQSLWAELEHFAKTGNGDSDTEYFKLPNLRPDQCMQGMDYASYVQKLEEANPEEEVNKLIVRQLLRRQLTRLVTPGRIDAVKKRVDQLLRSEMDYWKNRRPNKRDGQVDDGK